MSTVSLNMLAVDIVIMGIPETSRNIRRIRRGVT